MADIRIEGAREGNLQGIDLRIPREKLVVFTGVSGSGKTTLLVDVLYMECQRQYLEAMAFQGIRGPEVDRVHSVSPAIVIGQVERERNPRSTVGTVTGIYTDLRMVYEKLAVRPCLHCGKPVAAADCREETEGSGEDFKVYMYCCECGGRMEKLGRGDFSFNTRRGACPACEGMGRRMAPAMDRLVDERLSIEAGAVDLWKNRYKDYQTEVLYSAFRHFGVPVAPNTPVAAYTPLQRAILVHGAASGEVKALCPDVKPPKAVMDGRFEGLLPFVARRVAADGGSSMAAYLDEAPCPTCNGERLAALPRMATVAGTRLPELGDISLDALAGWLEGLKAGLPDAHRPHVEAYLRDLETKIGRLRRVGLDYLSLGRQTVTLSGGERQRVRLAATLDSDLVGVIYILDEPTAGLHPRDTQGMLEVLLRLRDLGNTVLVIEHDPEVMKAADWIVDIGPGAGKAGGRVTGEGTMEQLLGQPESVTGRWLAKPPELKQAVRTPIGAPVVVRGACRHNLRDVTVELPRGCLTAVTGVSGSGKSTLVFDVLARGWEGLRREDGTVEGLEGFDHVLPVRQAPLSRMKRSNVATYAGLWAEIRRLFAATEEAKAAGLTAKHFSFNTKGGRCEHCEGLGKISSNQLFFKDIEVVCPVCGGARFSPEVLAVRYEGHTISGVLDASVEEALEVFAGQNKLVAALQLLVAVGLGYLTLGQTLTTLSGGEAQRLKLAKELTGGKNKKGLYLLDEPTVGLHPQDVAHFLALLDAMVDAGNTVVVVEHDTQTILHADWVCDLGPEGGDKGGEVLFTGTPEALLRAEGSLTGACLRDSLRM